MQHVIHSIFFEVSLFDEHLSGCVEHVFGGFKSDALDGVNDPLVDFVGKLIQVDVVLFLGFAWHVAVHVDGVFRQH